MFVYCKPSIDNRNSQFIISNVWCSLFDHDHSYLEGILLHLYWGTKSCSLNYLPSGICYLLTLRLAAALSLQSSRYMHIECTRVNTMSSLCR